MGRIKGTNIAEGNPMWKGDDAGYIAKHMWLKSNFGKADACENREKQILDFPCQNTSQIFHYAKKKDREYTRNREDYYQLCVSCHHTYDGSGFKKGYTPHNKGKVGYRNAGSFPKGHKPTHGFKKGNVPWNKKLDK